MIDTAYILTWALLVSALLLALLLPFLRLSLNEVLSLDPEPGLRPWRF